MKHLIILLLAIVWLGCLVEFAALASAALEVQRVGSIAVSVLMLGWLGFTGLCAWKLTRRNPVTG